MTTQISDEMVRLGLIKQILGGTSFQNPRINLAVESMDDAALIKISDGESLAIASDFVRGSGFYLFQLGHMNYFDAGYYLVAANVSDIAAMGAQPIGIQTIIRYSKKMTDEEFTEIFRGMKAAADMFGAQIIGGDIGSYDIDVFAATAVGVVETEKALLRKNIQDNDLVCVTGTIGLPITALTYFKEVKKRGFSLAEVEEERLLKSWQRPNARVAEGMLLSQNSLANACQDVSDGLKATVEQISAVSGKTVSLYVDRLPIDETTRKMAAYLGVDPVRIAVSASVDFELFFTISPEKESLCAQIFESNGATGYTVIGEVNDLGRNVLIRSDGSQSELPGEAWKQQTDDYLGRIIRNKHDP